ncbi:MAG: class I SAM-dependent methyltransferase [Candidatus Omnitrophica bacterium]|nr:class I SAM-dependent methyltransferase [Candidatus Omnitrophota bacterium]
MVVKPKRERLLNWGHLEGDLRLIEEHGGLDSIVPEITTLKGLKRRLALWTSRLVLYLSRVMTKRQTQVNRSVLNSLGNMSHGFDRIEASLVELDKQMVNMKSDILSLEYRLDRLLEKTSGETGHSTADFLEERHHAMDALYLAFENRFRGSREEVKRRLEVYLPCMEEAAKNTESKKVVDLGCGRGEWLELLRESAFEANGVDTNRLQLEECRKRGLPAVEQEVLEHLRALPDASVAAITGFHIAEHLPFLVLIKILDETMRVLKPGGVIVLETPNPENVDVGACSFYLDPTHKNPLVPESLQFLAGQRGFINIDVIRLVQPFREKPLEPLAGTDVLTIKINALVGFLNNRFYSSQDFAVIGRKARVA